MNDQVCQSHSGLLKDIQWLKNSMYIGFSVLCSIILYFMVPLQSSIHEIQGTTMEINSKFLEITTGQEIHLREQELRISNIEVFCCSSLKGEDS